MRLLVPTAAAAVVGHYLRLVLLFGWPGSSAVVWAAIVFGMCALLALTLTLTLILTAVVWAALVFCVPRAKGVRPEGPRAEGRG